MLDSGIKDVHMEGLGKLFDKFSINLKDKEAETHFLMVLEECKNAIFGTINDGIHKWATYFKWYLNSVSKIWIFVIIEFG